MLITFTVKDQEITHDLGERPLIAGSKGVVYADFVFDDAWNGLDIVVTFMNQGKYGTVPVRYDGEAVAIPTEVLTYGKLFVGAVGFEGDQTRITTAKWNSCHAISVQPCGTVEGTDILKPYARSGDVSTTWEKVKNKPFTSVGEGLSVADDTISADVLSVNGKTGAVALGAADVGALDESTLDNAIDTALAQAKASGEFKGDKGDTGAEPSDERLIALITPIVTEQVTAINTTVNSDDEAGDNTAVDSAEMAGGTDA